MSNEFSSTPFPKYAAKLFHTALLFILLTTPTWAQIRPPGPATALPRAQAPASDGLRTIKNDKIEVGIDLNYGGALTYLAFLSDRGGLVQTRNMINNPDLGRSAQIALYSGPADYSKNGAEGWRGLGWDPIQAGDIWGNPSKIVAFEKQDNLLYVKCIPNQFAINNEPGEATIEHWLRLDGNVVKVHARVVLFRSNKTQYEARQQEMPCLYMNGNFRNMYYYRGSEPFTNGGADKIFANPPKQYIDFGDVYPTEPWMASLNDNGYGVGLYAPGNYDWKKGYFGADLTEGEFEPAASYIAATNFVLLDHNIVHEWDYQFVLGNLGEIRSHVNAQPRPAPGPNYRFDTSRKGFYYHSAQDTGWPIAGKLDIKINNYTQDHIKSPFVAWPGRQVPKIVVRAAFKNNNTANENGTMRLTWRRSTDVAILSTPDRYVNFPVKNDGQFHNYTIDLSQNDNWKNQLIGQIQLQANPDGPAVNGSIQIEWIAMSENGPDAEPDPVVKPPVVVIPPPVIEPPVVVIPPPVVEPPVVVIPPPVVEPPVVIIPPPVDKPCQPGCLTIGVKQIRFVRSGNK